MSTTGKQILDDVQALKNGKGYTSLGPVKVKAAISGGAIGFAAGAYCGYRRKKDTLVLALLGAIVGALVARIVLPK